MTKPKMGFANYDAWEWFNHQFSCFVDRHPALEALRDKIFVGRVEPKHHADYVIFGLGRVCIEDFEEILNLCGNGFGIGAMQILRSMFERQVTAAFISKYRDEVDAFAKYDYVHTRKLVEQFKEIYEDAPDVLNRIVPEAERDKIEANFQAARKDFMRMKCKKCKTEELMHSWHRLDLPTMASKGQQPALKDFVPYQYSRSLWMAHATFKSLEARVVEKGDGYFSFESDGQRNYIKEALVNAHHLLLMAFHLQIEHFSLGLDKDWEACEKDFLECWNT